MVQSIEELRNGLFVCLLRAGETGAVDAIVYGLVDGVYGRVDLVSQSLGEEMCVCSGELAELGVEHSDDLARLVVDNDPRLFIPENGRRDASRVVGICLRVDLPQEVGIVYRVGDDAGLVVKAQPSSPIKDPTAESPMTSSSPFSLRMIAVLWAQGHAQATYR